MKRRHWLAAGAIVAAALATTAAPALMARTQKAAAMPLYKDPSQPVERRVDDLLRRMTLDEKVAQLVTVWEHKDRIQTPDGTFVNYPDGNHGVSNKPSMARPLIADWMADHLVG